MARLLALPLWLLLSCAAPRPPGPVAPPPACPDPDQPRASAGAAPLFDKSRMVEPVPVVRPRVHYTSEALEKGVQGVCLVRCIVRVDGRPTDCCVARSLPYLDRTVVDAVEGSQWRPATLDGKPIEVAYEIRFTFKLPEAGSRRRY